LISARSKLLPPLSLGRDFSNLIPPALNAGAQTCAFTRRLADLFCNLLCFRGALRTPSLSGQGSDFAHTSLLDIHKVLPLTTPDTLPLPPCLKPVREPGWKPNIKSGQECSFRRSEATEKCLNCFKRNFSLRSNDRSQTSTSLLLKDYELHNLRWRPACPMQKRFRSTEFI